MELSAQISHLMTEVRFLVPPSPYSVCPSKSLTSLSMFPDQVAFGRLQEATVEDRIDASTYFYDLPQATERRNAVIFEGPAEGQKLTVVDMVHLLAQDDSEKGVGKTWIYPGALQPSKCSDVDRE